MTNKTLLDEIAIEAMKAMVRGFIGGPSPSDADIARYSYDLAEAMLAESEKRLTPTTHNTGDER